MDLDELTPATLLEQGLGQLAALLGPTWRITPLLERDRTRGADVVVQVQSEGDSVYTQLLVDLKTSLTPRAAAEALLPKADLLRKLNNHINLVVVAPWISPKTQDVLREHDIGYLDLTGNVSLRVSRPAIVIHTEGSTRPPRALAQPQSKTTLNGVKAGRLVRLLTDVQPPYRAGELAQASGLSLAYVSRLLDTLEDQLLIRREARVIRWVDWPNLLRVRAEESSLLRPKGYSGMLAPNGAPTVLERMRGLPPVLFDGLAVTGPYAAHQVAPLSAGGQLVLYVAPRLDRDDVGDELGLLPVSEGADVLLVQAPDGVVFERATTVNGVHQVALSQLALDCLSGPGRMPAAGEAVMAYMAQTEDEWRASSVFELRSPSPF